MRLYLERLVPLVCGTMHYGSSPKLLYFSGYIVSLCVLIPVLQLCGTIACLQCFTKSPAIISVSGSRDCNFSGNRATCWISRFFSKRRCVLSKEEKKRHYIWKLFFRGNSKAIEREIFRRDAADGNVATRKYQIHRTISQKTFFCFHVIR